MPNIYNNGYRGSSNGSTSRALKPHGTVSRDGRMRVNGNIWVWNNSGKPVASNRGSRRY